MNGNGTTVDSFDSGNTNYSTGGQYDASKRESSGDVGTDSSIVNSIGIGNGNIYGHVMTGPGTVQSAVQMGPNGGIGTVAWQASNSGIQPGYWSGDFNVTIPDVQPPGGAALNLPAPTNGYYVLSNGFYSTVVSPVLPVKITGGAVTLWVQNSFSQGVTITNGGSLVLYVGATNTLIGHSVSIGGNGNINSPGLAKNLQIYGLPSLTSISFQGNAAFAGTIYAPEADMTGGGGGNNTQDTSGAMIVKSVTLNGHWNFHYDEALRNNGPTRGWIAKNWTEKKYP
jgi:hypothetical protein